MWFDDYCIEVPSNSRQNSTKITWMKIRTVYASLPMPCPMPVAFMICWGTYLCRCYRSLKSKEKYLIILGRLSALRSRFLNIVFLHFVLSWRELCINVMLYAVFNFIKIESYRILALHLFHLTLFLHFQGASKWVFGIARRCWKESKRSEDSYIHGWNRPSWNNWKNFCSRVASWPVAKGINSLNKKLIFF